jgi:GIY-YIG catalytic domain
MPRKPIDWSKCMFYRLVCRDPTVTECYVGSTCNEVDRRYKHKSACTNQKSKKHNFYVYRFIREHGSWDNWELIVHEKLPMNNEFECKIRERYWVEQYKANLNKQIPSRTQAEYYVDHKEKINRRHAAYNAANEAHLKTKHTCECGGCYTTNHMSHHNKSKRHTTFEAAK